MNLHPIILGLMISVACCTGYSADVELAKLEKAFEKSLETESQAGINTAAGNISAHLDKQLLRLEEKIEKEIAPAEGAEDNQERTMRLDAFKKAAAQWRAYRAAIVELDDIGTGSIMPIVRSSRYSLLTRQRITFLINSMHEFGESDPSYDEFKVE
jgi:uncharacterized protein YecT (DUF1311 family)